MTSTATASPTDRLRAEHGNAIAIGTDCDLPADLLVELDADARLVLGHRVGIRRGTTIQVHRGATVVIGDDVAIGENVFLSAMAGIRIGTGAALSNMVDLHDHNHRERSTEHVPGGELLPWASGFEAAPIIIEPGAVLSNKVTVTAGVRIGANCLIAANAVVSHSLAPDTVAAGVPATGRRTFTGAAVPAAPDRRTLRLGFFGTSIMEHLEGYNAQLVNQADLPEIGSTVTVEGWHPRGWVHRLRLTLQAAWPHLGFEVDNHGEGGATSRDITQILNRELDQGARYDLVFLGCGINDVWRGFQGRTAEAVDRGEYAHHYTAMLARLTAASRTVVCVTETPFGPIEDTATVEAMNRELAEYNQIATRAAVAAGAHVLDVWPAFTTAARQLPSAGATDQPALWSDGVHLSELGDALLLRLAEAQLTEARTIEALVDYPRLDRDHAVTVYRPLFAADR